MSRSIYRYLCLLLPAFVFAGQLSAQEPKASTSATSSTPQQKQFVVEEGVLKEVTDGGLSTYGVEKQFQTISRKELKRQRKQEQQQKRAVAKELRIREQELRMEAKAQKNQVRVPVVAKGDSTALHPDSLSHEIADSLLIRPRYSALFRDTMPLSRMTAISIVIPGFSQVHNKDYWKLPILYSVVGGLTYLGIRENNKFQPLRKEFDRLMANPASRRTELEPVQSAMIRHNTRRTIYFAGALATYIYFLADGVLNHPQPNNSVKMATTLSTLLPGAGQFYNRSYWKVPIVMGAFTTMAYVIDFNSRGYNRFKTAYTLLTDGDPNTVDEFGGRMSAEQLKTLKKNYRRNRDLSIIMTAGLYILNIVDAHVDAHLKDYDISDDLAIRVQPTMMQYYTQRHQNVHGFGLSVNFTF